MNSRKHSRLRRIQMHRRTARVMRKVFAYVYENNRPMIEAAISDQAIYGHIGCWSISDDGVLTYERVTDNTSE